MMQSWDTLTPEQRTARLEWMARERQQATLRNVAIGAGVGCALGEATGALAGAAVALMWSSQASLPELTGTLY